MADLKENYKDDILDTSQNTKRKYDLIENQDGTVSLDDVTEYLQEGDSFGASDINAITHFINNIHLDALQGVLYNSGDTSALANSIDAYIAQANMSDNTTQNVILSNNSTATKWIVEITRVGDNYSGTALKTTTNNDYRYSFIKIGGASTEISPFSKPPKYVRGTNISSKTWTTVSGAKIGDIIVLAAGGGGLNVSGASQLYYWNTNNLNIGAYRVTSVNPQVRNGSTSYDVAYVLISSGD